MSPEAQQQPYAEPAPPQLTAEQLAALKAAEADLASDLKQAGEEAKARSRQLTPELLAVIEETERRGLVRRMADAELMRDLFAQDARLARVFAVSGVFSDIKGTTPEQAIATAMTKIRMGRAWGLHEADSMQYIYFTNGRPAVMNEIIASKLKDAGWDWDVRMYEAPDGTCIGCGLFPKHWDEHAGQWVYLEEIDPTDPKGERLRRVEVKFTKADADRAKIWEKGKQIPLSMKWNFVSWPGDMYFWRCIGRLKRRYATNVLAGALTVDEAQEMEPESHQPMRATMNLDQFRPSSDPNRGHDAAMPPQDSAAAATAPSSALAPAQAQVPKAPKPAAPQPAAAPAPALTPAVGSPAPVGAPVPADDPGPPEPPPAQTSPFARPKFGARPAPTAR